MSNTAWQDGIERTQLILRQQPDRCFVCGQEVPKDCPACPIQAYLDDERQRRIAVVCGRVDCLEQLAGPTRETWQSLFEALIHWPEKAIYPRGPYWTVQRIHRFSFRTEQRRTRYVN